MNYYLLTQGTKSKDSSFIVKNGKIIPWGDCLRDDILNNFNKIDKKGVRINEEQSKLNIIKYKNNYLLEVLTTNTDRLDRNIPVELLLENYDDVQSLKKNLIKMESILEIESILVDKTIWMSIPFQIEKELKRYLQKKKLIYIFGISIVILLISIIILLKN